MTWGQKGIEPVVARHRVKGLVPKEDCRRPRDGQPLSVFERSSRTHASEQLLIGIFIFVLKVNLKTYAIRMPMLVQKFVVVDRFGKLWIIRSSFFVAPLPQSYAQ